MSFFTLLRTKHAQSILLCTRPAPAAALHVTFRRSEVINNFTQGHAVNPKNLHPQDVQCQPVRAGLRARKDETNCCIDAANQCAKAGEGKRPGEMGTGNPERVGFVEQIGGASETARKFEKEDRQKK